jgi:hypothetical protein
MELHVAALFTQDGGGRLLRINEPNGRGGSAPRVFVGQTADARIVRCRADVDEQQQEALRAAAAELPSTSDPLGMPLDAEPFRRILEPHAPITAVEAGPAYYCPAHLSPDPRVVTITTDNAESLRSLLPDWAGDVVDYQPMVVVLEGDHAVSLCASVRRTADAHEAGVDTAPSARGRGYAPLVVAAWAALVHGGGCMPLYSTAWGNQASRVVARKLGLVQFGNDLHLT